MLVMLTCEDNGGRDAHGAKEGRIDGAERVDVVGSEDLRHRGDYVVLVVVVVGMR